MSSGAIEKTVVLFAALLLFPCFDIQAVDHRSVELSFKRFCARWIDDMRKPGRNGITCRKRASGYIAEYTGYSTNYQARVSRTGSAGASYVGILTYREITYACCARTKEAALGGPFASVSEHLVTELFLYADGRWQY